MFSHILTLAITALPLLAAANPIHPAHNSTCSSGPVQCCDTTATAGSKKGADALGLLGIVLEDLNVVLGLQCLPISIIGVGLSASCGNQAMCCQDNSHGAVAIDCLPIQL
ncbi:fungal hydrophobin-domain-containing protein [Fomes fomentarius]|nr:fungal hydrophobin-domain-containing protein [Fomes fomentarius]